jgi:N-methylhydantoinase A/oxoprolinase/acetone carboxylase beta subunit
MNLAGLDVGGTLTDLILMGEATGQVRIAKVPTTVRNQAEGVLAAKRWKAGVRRPPEGGRSPPPG